MFVNKKNLKEITMKKVLSYSVLLAASINVAYAFNLGNLTKKLEEATKQMQQGATGAGGGGGAAGGMPNLGSMAGGSAGGGGSTKNMDGACERAIGAPFNNVAISGSPESLVSKYFDIGEDKIKFEMFLLDALNKPQSTVGDVGQAFQELRDKKIIALARGYLRDPSSRMLAQVIHFAEKGDKYQENNVGSEWGDAQALLAVLMMQYSERLKDKNQVLAIVKQGSNQGKSNLSKVLYSRIYLFGEFGPKDLNSFDGYITNLHWSGGSKLKDDAIVHALKNEKNWKHQAKWNDAVAQSASLSASMKKEFLSGTTSKSDAYSKRATVLYKRGVDITILTAEALGAGDKINQLRAVAEQLKKDGSANTIEVLHSEDVKATKILADQMKATTQLDDGAKAKLAEANKRREENLSLHYALVQEGIMLFASGQVGEVVQNIGPKLNSYFKAQCQIREQRKALETKLAMPATNPAGEKADTKLLEDGDLGEDKKKS